MSAARHRQLGREFKWSNSELERDGEVAKMPNGSGIAPTSDEIYEAKETGECPRCDAKLDTDGVSGLCLDCGFSF